MHGLRWRDCQGGRPCPICNCKPAVVYICASLPTAAQLHKYARWTCQVVLCCAVLCCAVLCCAVLCCAVLCCAVLCCAVSQHANFQDLLSSATIAHEMTFYQQADQGKIRCYHLGALSSSMSSIRAWWPSRAEVKVNFQSACQQHLSC